MPKQEALTLNAPWGQETADVLEALDVSPEAGLSDAEAQRRRRQYGPNRMRQKESQAAWQIFARQFKSTIVLILAGAAVVSFVLGQTVDGAAITVAVLVNTVIGFAMEIRAVRSMESLRAMEQVAAKVIRDGHNREVSANGLVPGDIVTLEGGDVVSADLRLFEANKVRANESALTGESTPVGKTTAPVERDAPLSERKNMLFKGTAVTTGSCHAVVTHTGMKTELGQIASLVQEAEDEQTPLERRLEVLGRRLLWITLGILIVVAAAGIARGKETFLMVKTAVALAVAAIPEGLPIVATIAMARGMLRMAKHNALVNHLAAVETLGSTTVICTDKTGTLTENRMTVTHVVLDDDQYTVRDGPKTSSAFTRDDRPVEPDDCPTLKQLLEASVLCNNASLGTDGGAPAVGDPLETALLEAGVKAGIDRDSLLDCFPEEREESFDPATKMMATFNRGENGYRVMVKGAPEAVLRAVTQIQTDTEVHELTAEHKQQWNERNLELAQEGLRLLAVATKTTQSIDTEPYEDLTLLGLVAMLDPPRDDVPEAMTRCQEAGIRVVMVTGDHRATALSVAQAIGLDATEDNAIEGTRIQSENALSEQDRRYLLEAPVFARVSPEQKLNLIDLHKQAGGVVAMTGDGVNDAPALKKADIGVAMGRRGTQVARDAADMILKNDAFSSIVVAVEQGRIIFDNIRTFVLYLLSGNVSEILVVFFASLLNWPLPILPLQILFLNVINDVFPALALGVGKGREGVMNQQPRDPQEPVLRGSDWWAIFAYGGLIMIPVLGSYWLVAGVLNEGHPEAVTASFLTLAFARLWHIFNMRSADSGLIHNEIVTNRWIWGALVLCCGLLLSAVYTPGLAGVLSLSSPGAQTWIVIAALSLIPPILGQTIKVMQRVHRERNTQAKG